MGKRNFFRPETHLYNAKGEYQGTAIFTTNTDGELEIVEFRGRSRKFRAELGGDLTNDSIPASYRDCDTQDERIAYLWAHTICEHPMHAWYNDPADPGIVSNKRFTQEGWDKLPVHIRQMARKFANEDNQMCAEDRIRRRKPWIDGGR